MNEKNSVKKKIWIERENGSKIVLFICCGYFI